MIRCRYDGVYPLMYQLTKPTEGILVEVFLVEAFLDLLEPTGSNKCVILKSKPTRLELGLNLVSGAKS